MTKKWKGEKRIPVEPPKIRREGGVTDISNQGWHNDSARHAAAARGVKTTPEKHTKEQVFRAMWGELDDYGLVEVFAERDLSLKADRIDRRKDPTLKSLRAELRRRGITKQRQAEIFQRGQYNRNF